VINCGHVVHSPHSRMAPSLTLDHNSYSLSFPQYHPWRNSRRETWGLSMPTKLSPVNATPFVMPSVDLPIPTAAPSLSPASTKRKHGQGMQQVECLLKRRRLIGRPTNCWTRTRLRQLVRLYLMTNLDVTEISKVLRAGEFKPW